MSRPAIKWGKLKRYVLKHGYQIRPSGGDKIIIAPNSEKLRSRNHVRIGHKSSNGPGSEVLPCYLNSIERAFGITRHDILNG